MPNQPTRQELQRLLDDLLRLDRDTEWAAFHAESDWKALGPMIAGLANAAALNENPCGYLLCGVNAVTRTVDADVAHFFRAEIQTREFETELLQRLTPRLAPQAYWLDTKDGAPVLLIEVPAADSVPVRFEGEDWIRVGSRTERLADFPEKERFLWRSFEKESFETEPATAALSPDEVFDRLSLSSYLRHMVRPRPKTEEALLERMAADRLLIKAEHGLFAVTRLGALAFAHEMSAFPSVARKALRITRYVGNSRLRAEKECLWNQGYATDFEGLVRLIKALLPSREIIGEALRREEQAYPEVILRELLMNALIHQDFRLSGCGPMLEIFDDRIEITNPGRPLVDVDRLIDTPPRARNVELARLMRRMDLCKGKGVGIDRAVDAAEAAKLPALEFEAVGDHFKAVVTARKPFKELTLEERLRICRQHCDSQYAKGEAMTLATLRERLEVEPTNVGAVRRIVEEALVRQQIQLLNPGAAPRNRSYQPYWAPIGT